MAAQATYCAEDQEYVLGISWHTVYNFQESKIDGGWANSERLKAFASNLES